MRILLSQKVHVIRIITLISMISLVFILANACRQNIDSEKTIGYYPTGKPYIRWWWFARILEKEDISNQLDWIREQGFGGVEIAFVYPVNRDPLMPRTPWLSEEWTDMITFTKKYCDSTGLGCDFTFGTLWPFGGTFVPDEDRTKIFGDTSFKQPLRLSWTHPDTGNVIDHLSKEAFIRYAHVMGNAMEPALQGSPSALFCDSWEVETRRIWTHGFDSAFLHCYGYDIKPYMMDILKPEYFQERYDYMKLVSEYVIGNFYIPFTEKAHELGAFSRAQCAGSPADLIAAYSIIDVPETEAMLYNPDFSRIVASAAALSGKNVVSSETFTCIYGWPRNHMFEEDILDLKLVADALFANGTNQIIWHGLPYNPIEIDTIFFYATVHAGKNGSLEKHLKPFNQYLELLSKNLRKGRVYSDIALYLPLEDNWIAGEYADSLQMPWSWGAYELRYLKVPEELKGYQPLWINREYLERARVEDNKMIIGELEFEGLYVDVQYLDIETMTAIAELKRQGLPVYLKRTPERAGKSIAGKTTTDLIVSMEKPLAEEIIPLIEGKTIPEFWARHNGDTLWVFFSNPEAWNLQYPLEYRQSGNSSTRQFSVIINWKGKSIPLDLLFEPNQSLLFQINDNKVKSLCIGFNP